MDSNVKVALIGAIAGICGAVVSGGFALLASRANEKADKTLQETKNLLRYEYHGSSVVQTSVGGGRMVVVLDASTKGTPASTRIDMDQFVKLCGDADGCTLTMGVTGIRPINSTETLTVPVIGPPCHFFYSPVNKQWTISESCIAILGMYKPKSDNSGYEFDSVYQGYVYGNVYGVDDSEVNGVDPDKAPLYVIGFKTACYLAESAPDTRANGQGKLMPDVEDGTGKGLFLIASDPSWESANFKLSTWDLSDPNRQCVLIVDD